MLGIPTFGCWIGGWLINLHIRESLSASHKWGFGLKRVTVIIVTCQAHPVLVKERRNKCAVRSFENFYLGGYLTCLFLRTKGSLAPCLVDARVVRWRPRLAGTQQYIENPIYKRL